MGGQCLGVADGLGAGEDGGDGSTQFVVGDSGEVQSVAGQLFAQRGEVDALISGNGDDFGLGGLHRSRGFDLNGSRDGIRCGGFLVVGGVLLCRIR